MLYTDRDTQEFLPNGRLSHPTGKTRMASSAQRSQQMATQDVQSAPTPVAARPADTGDTIATLLIEAGHLTPQQLTYAKRV
jgi:predicted Zn-dependent protease